MAWAGQLSSRTGRRRFFEAWGLLAAVAGPVLWLAIVGTRSFAMAATGAALLQVCTVCAYGPVGA